MDTLDTKRYIEAALNGDREALEKLLGEIQGPVFNLALRMLGNLADAEDATQDILIKVMTNLSSFRQESGFSTWVYRISANYLIGYRKSRFAQPPLSFSDFEADLNQPSVEIHPEETGGVDTGLLAEELRQSCTNVMLQCLDGQSRLIFILGTMFHLDSQTAGDILGLRPENYRQKLSRSRKKMGDFLMKDCGLSGTGFCSCEKRVGYAVSRNRLNPHRLEYTSLQTATVQEAKLHMETLDALSSVFSNLPLYEPTLSSKEFLQRIIQSPQMSGIIHAGSSSRRL